ncbi:hypothetical protein AMTRI_Chr03g45540 [Amborella trichopoda]
MAGWGPDVVMISLQLLVASADIVSKGALERGMNYHVFIVYRHIVFTLVLFPCAHFLERKTRPSLTRPVLFKLFLLALCGITGTQNAYFVGLMHSSPTVVGAMNNLCPAITYILAIIFRMESVNIRSCRGQSKLLGTSICLGGAMLFTFYKGHLFPTLKSPFINIHDWVRGSSLAIVSTLCWSVFLILQASLYKVYPAPLSMNGILVSAIGYSLNAGCISKRGPVFVALFFPLQLIIAVILSALILMERLHLGSVLGGCLIILGFYCVMWGKSKDDNNEKVEEKSGN